MRFRRRLTDEEMEWITEQVQVGTPEGLVAFYNVALGDEHSTYEEQGDIDPKQFAIPADQWAKIVDASPRGTGRVWFGLDFMNVGPSSYREE